MSQSEFKKVLRDFHFRATGKTSDPSANYKPSAFKDTPESLRGTLEYWMNDNKSGTHWHKPRTMAYLSAYTAYCEGDIPAMGIQVGDKYIYADRAIMRSLLVGLCVTLDETSKTFRLTDKGRALVVPFVTWLEESA